MSTPIVDIPMPYGVTVRSKGAAIPSLVGTHPKQNNNVSLKLPAGPCRIAASWEGTEEMRLVVQNQGEATSRTVATIPGGGGVHVPSWSPSEQSRATRCISPGRNQPASPAPSRSIRSTSSSAPRPGGGVGDHPERRLYGDHAPDSAVHRDYRGRADAQDRQPGLCVFAEGHEHGASGGDRSRWGAGSCRSLQKRRGKDDSRCRYSIGGDGADLHRDVRKREPAFCGNVVKGVGDGTDSRAGGNRHRRNYNHSYAGPVAQGVVA